MAYRGRFAPSPTGPLHPGSLVAALVGWVRTRQQQGTWLVRIEDVDPPREPAGAAASILATLKQLGLGPDAPVLYQSERGRAYQGALRVLVGRGDAFPYWCSRADLERAGAPHRDGRCVSAPRPDRAPAWRLRVPDGIISFTDGLQGPQRQNVRAAVGDFVLRRSDGLWSYQFACVVDDAFQRITEVVRGLDLLDSTPRQILLQRLLGLPTPAYRHFPLVLDAAGHKLSKSAGSIAIDPDHPADALAAALRQLGLDVPVAAGVTDLLRTAVQQFHWRFPRTMKSIQPREKEQP